MADMPRDTFKRFFDSLSPTFGHMISLGQSNTIVSCPALTTHSEMDEAALAAASMSPTTIRFAVGDEDPADLIRHLVHAAKATIDPDIPGFSEQFMAEADVKSMIRDTYVNTHEAHVKAQLDLQPSQWF